MEKKYFLFYFQKHKKVIDAQNHMHAKSCCKYTYAIEYTVLTRSQTW